MCPHLWRWPRQLAGRGGRCQAPSVCWAEAVLQRRAAASHRLPAAERARLGFFGEPLALGVLWWGLGSSWRWAAGHSPALPAWSRPAIRRPNIAFTNRASAATGEVQHIAFLFQKPCWCGVIPHVPLKKSDCEEVVVILVLENRPARLNPALKTWVCASWTLIISYHYVKLSTDYQLSLCRINSCYSCLITWH